jgi:type II secretory pathway pseudopilin PulG
MIRNQLHHTYRAFTIIETLVAVTIITVVLVAPFQLVENSLKASYVARDELIANSLAQEGVEYALRVRDNNFLATYPALPGVQWLQGIDGTGGGGANCLATNKCIIDLGQNTILACPAGNCSTLPLYLNSSTHLYTQVVAGSPTRFVRSIQLCYIGGASCTTQTNEAKLTVTVTWSTSHQAYSTTLVEYLENWL